MIRRKKDTSEENPVDWLPNSAWWSLVELGKFAEFAKLPQDINEASSRFMEWFNHVSPESEKLSLDWAALDKTPFLKLLVVSCLRPDRLTVALRQFINATLPPIPEAFKTKTHSYTEYGTETNSTNMFFNALRDTETNKELDLPASPTIPIFFILTP